MVRTIPFRRPLDVGHLTEIEVKFQKRLKKRFPDFADIQILTPHAMIHGIVTSPFLTPDQAAEILGMRQLCTAPRK